MIFNSLEIQNAEIEAILESAARVFYVRQSDADGVDATAFVSGATISDGIIGARLETMREEAKARSADLTPEERKTNAEVAALESARARALDQVMGIESSLGSMGEILANHPEAGAEIKTWVESAEPEEFTHSPDGVCSTSIKLDMHKPFELIQKYSEQTKPKPKPKKAKKKSAPKAAPKSANEVLPAAPTPAVASEVQGNQP